MAEEPTNGSRPEPHLVRQLGVWSAAAVLVGSTVGSGIFRVPSSVAAETGTAWGIASVWAVGAVVSLFGALTMAELATLYPRSGGIYVFLRETYGRGTAFLFGWTQLVVIRPSALGAIAMIFAEYLGDLVPLSPTGVRWLAAAAILGVGVLNMRSVRWGAWLENGTTGAKVLALGVMGLLALVVAGGWTGVAPPSDPGTVPPVQPGTWSGFGIALVAALWAYDGWADLTFMSGEVNEPARTLPRALAGGVLVVVLLYLLLNGAYLMVLSVGEMAGSELVAADAARRLGGATGSHVVSALVVLSTFGALNGAMMTGPRIFFAMAKDGLMPRPVASVSARFGTPWAAVALATVLGIGYVSVRSFEELAGGFVLGIWPFYALAVGAVILLRRRIPHARRPYRTPGYPWVPVTFLMASVGMLLSALVQEPRLTLVGFGIIAAGVPVYAIVRRRAIVPSGG
jgi:amino acid transporter